MVEEITERDVKIAHFKTSSEHNFRDWRNVTHKKITRGILHPRRLTQARKFEFTGVYYF